MIQHEDALRDQRFGWLLALNGLLFTALGFVWNDSRSVALINARPVDILRTSSCCAIMSPLSTL